MPAKLWADFERLTASDLNTYLAQQVVAVFANAAARDLALPAPVDGQIAYLADLDRLTIYDGAAWDEYFSTLVSTIEAAADQSIPNGVATKLVMPTVLDDSLGAALGNNELTIPANKGGLFLVTAEFTWASTGTATGQRNLDIRVGGTVQKATDYKPGMTVALTQRVATLLRFTPGQLVQAFALQSTGAALTVWSAYGTRLSIVRIGA
jgi:hypothetical protein